MWSFSAPSAFAVLTEPAVLAGTRVPAYFAAMPLPRPAPDEFAPFYAGYVRLVKDDDDVLTALERQADETARILGGVAPDRETYRYAPGKWSVREITGHLADVERVLSYRALRFARGDPTPLPGFDENAYVPGARFERRGLAALSRELAAVRQATLALFRTFDHEEWDRAGEANGSRMTTRAVPFVILGHERHHLNVLAERYGVRG